MAKIIGAERLRHYWKLYFFVLPSVSIVALFSYYPAVNAIYRSFFRWNGDNISNWVGMGNFAQVLGNFWLWIPVLLLFLLVLRFSSRANAAADVLRIASGVFVPLTAAVVLFREGHVFVPEFVPVLSRAYPFFSIWILFFAIVFLTVGRDNPGKWVYLSIPVSLLIVCALKSFFGFRPVSAWLLMAAFAGTVIWALPERWAIPKINGARTFQAFIGLGFCVWALAKYAGGDPKLWGGFSIIAILVAFNVVKMLPSILTAVVINRLKNESVNYFYRVLFVVPMIIPGMVGLLLWKFFFNPNQGLFNRVLAYTRVLDLLVRLDEIMGWGGVFKEGIMPVWLGHEHLVLPALILWGFPWVGIVGVLIYLAGLQGIPSSVYEAADLDGAGSVGKFLHIELPLILTQVRINMVLMVIRTLKTYAFILILFGINGGPNGKLLVPGLYMFQTAFRDAFAGYACAIGLVIFFFILVLTEINNRYIRVEK